MIQIRHFIGGYDKNLSYLIWCQKSKKAANKYLFKNYETLKEFENFLEETYKKAK